MLKGGLMLRLIDIVFILLFGFLAISEIVPQHPIEPPKSSEKDSQKQKKEKIFFLGITRSETYILETPENETFNHLNFMQVRTILDDISSQMGADNKGVRVHICSNWDLPIKYAMDVADICDANNILKSIVVRKIEKPIK